MLEIEPKVDESVWKEFASLIGNLSLESCSRECIPVTEQWGWKAPKNKAFRISGHFIVDSDQSDIEYRYMPLRSAAVWIDEHRELYEEYLKEANGNKNEALRELVNDITWGAANDIPPAFFDGKWLVIHPDLAQNFEIDKGGRLAKPELIIKSDVEAWTDRNEYFEEIRDINPQSSMITEVFFESQELGQHWKQYCAEAVLGKCKIELIDAPEKEKKYIFLNPKTKSIFIFPKEPEKEEHILIMNSQ